MTSLADAIREKRLRLDAATEAKVASEIQRLRDLLRQIACNSDAEWGRQLARQETGTQ